MKLLSSMAESSHFYIITILPDDTRNNTTACTINVEELVHSALSLLVIIPVLLFIASRKSLRTKKSHQLFLNLLLIHICFNVSVIVSNFVSCSNAEVIINCSLLMSMFFGLVLLSLERMISIKFPFAYKNVGTFHVLITIVVSWIPGTLFLSVLLVRGTTETTLDITTTSLIATATVMLTISNAVVYRAAKDHDQFVKNNTLKLKNQPDHGKMLKASFMCFALVGSFVVLWLPYLVHNILAFVGVYKPDSDNLFSKMVEHIAQFNAIADVVLFFWLSRELKKEVKIVVNKLRGQDVDHDDDHHTKHSLLSKISNVSRTHHHEVTTV